jgi:hypothetical protein
VAVLSFAKTDADTVFLRNAIFRMILSRAKGHLTDPADIDQLDISEPIGAISFDRLADDQRMRLLDAVYAGTQSLKQQIAAGKPTEESVRPGIEEKLDEILALLSRFRQ